jgi:hypothetical protein
VTAQASLRLLAAAAAVAGCQATASTLQPRASEPDPPAASIVTEPTLRQVDGSLRYLFSVSFTADHSVLASVTGLVAQRVARTASGGEVEVTFPPGVPYPRGVGAVLVRDVPDPQFRSVYDHLARPPGISERPGQAMVTSHRIAGRPTQYLIVWHDRNTGEHDVTLFDASDPQAPQPVIARSRAPILGVAQSPTTWAADYYVTVWTLARDGGPGGTSEVIVEAYTWRPAGA